MTPPTAADDEDQPVVIAPAAPEPGRPPAIDLAGVTAGWRGRAPALVDVSLTLAAGATAVVHGGPGAGKTALLHVLRAAMIPTAGRAAVLGSDIASLAPAVRRALRRRIGYIAATPLLAAAENTFMAAAAPLRLTERTLSPRQAADVTEILGYLGLGALAAAPVEDLSGSQRRLTAIARAFVAQPDVLLADEPLAGLGPDAMSRVLRLLAEIARQQAAVVIATQTPDMYAALPARKVRLDRGRLAP
ncbi:MAG: ATP-binding cassette domain-containing protein [Hyphomonadaceae bacterium]|nr:ATP-binding cassette domain-containing protein [Hyphomonadaceae bacterium]